MVKVAATPYRSHRISTLAILLCVGVVMPMASTETVFGGVSSFTVTVLASPRLPGLVEPISAVSLAPALSVYGPVGEFHARGLVGLVSISPTALLDEATADLLDTSLIPLVERIRTIPLLRIDELRLTLFPIDALRVDVGRFSHNPGYALLNSPNRHFGQPAATIAFNLLTGASPTFGGEPETLLGLTGFLGGSYGRVVLAPSPTTPSLPTVPGSWLPDVGIPEAIEIPELSPDPISLDEISIEPTERLQFGYRRISGAIEIGVTTMPVSAAVVYFHGIDPDPVIRGRLDFKGGVPPTRFDLAVDPLEAVVDVLGIAGEGSVGLVTYWLDGAFTFNKTVATTEVDSISRRTIIVTAPSLAMNVGASYQLARVSILAEYAYSHTYSDAPLVQMTTPQLAVCAVEGQSQSGALRGVLGGALSPTDLSAGLFVSGVCQPSDELAVTLSIPIVLGAEDSFFGQYSNVLAAQIVVTYGF